MLQTVISMLRGLDMRVRSMEREVRYMQCQQGQGSKVALSATVEDALAPKENRDALWGLANGMQDFMPGLAMPGKFVHHNRDQCVSSISHACMCALAHRSVQKLRLECLSVARHGVL
jgi:hypothetical protein